MSRDMMVHKAHKRLKMGKSHFHNSIIINMINSIHKKIEETSHNNMAHLEITLERMANAIDALTNKISKQTDLLKEIKFSENSEETKRYPWATGQEKQTLMKNS